MLAQARGYENDTDRRISDGERLAKELGYECYKDLDREYRHERGEYLPSEFNEDCSVNFGILKGEELFARFLVNYFERVKHMKNNNRGFDFICENPRQEFINKYPQFRLERDKEYKLQFKSRCIKYNNMCNWSGWDFRVDHNSTADIFIFSSWSNREDLEPLHVWIFLREDIIRDRPLWKRVSLCISNTSKGLVEFDNNELKDELENLKELWEQLKDIYLRCVI